MTRRERYGFILGRLFGAAALAGMLAWAGAQRGIPWPCEPTWYCLYFWICCI
jgi:hypothetical protein